jgi:hypothetical protein
VSSTLRHLAYPALATGTTLTSTAVAWTWPASYTEIVPVNIITSTFYIAGLSVALTTNATLDTRLYTNFSLAKGTAGSETEIIQFPSAYYNDSSIGTQEGFQFTLPEAVEVAANTRIAGRVAHGESAAQSYVVKVVYEIV